MSECVLHSCCGPCASHCCFVLREAGLEPILFYSNSNIFPRTEFEKRWASVQKLAAALNLKAVCDEYNHEAWLLAVKGLEKEKEGGLRCEKCFLFNLTRASKFSEEKGLSFTTSLTVSPHKNSKVILPIGKTFKNFLTYDFKKQNGFLHSVELAKKFALYRQSYCGCEFSVREGVKE